MKETTSVNDLSRKNDHPWVDRYSHETFWRFLNKSCLNDCITFYFFTYDVELFVLQFISSRLKKLTCIDLKKLIRNKQTIKIFGWVNFEISFNASHTSNKWSSWIKNRLGRFNSPYTLCQLKQRPCYDFWIMISYFVYLATKGKKYLWKSNINFWELILFICHRQTSIKLSLSKPKDVVLKAPPFWNKNKNLIKSHK